MAGGTTRTRLLVSVRSSSEALAALEGGADLIDVKEPLLGSLGQAGAAIWRQVCAAVGQQAIVTAALGELAEQSAGSLDDLPANIGLYKLGLARVGVDWREQLTTAAAAVGMDRFVAVAYADHARAAAPAPAEVVAWAIENRVAGLLLDTAVKDGAHLFCWFDDDALRALIERAHEADLIVALAGSLKREHVGRCVRLQPEVIAVRGAACRQGDRQGVVQAAIVAELASVIADAEQRDRQREG